MNNTAFAKVALCVACTLAAGGCRRSPEQRAAEYLRSGKTMLKQKDYPRALLQFGNARQLKPRDAEVHFQIAQAYVGQEDWENAVTSLRRAIEFRPGYTAAQLQLAEMMSSSSDKDLLEEAYKRLTDISRDRPDNPDVLAALAMTEWKLSRRDMAEQRLRSAFEKFPQNLSSTVSLAKVMLERGDYAGAEDVLKKAASAQYAPADLIVALGEFYSLRRRYPEAETEFRRALTVDAKNPRALNDLAANLVYTGKLPEAETLYRRLADLPERQYHALYGIYLLNSNHAEGARVEFTRILKRDPDDRSARSGLVSALLALNRTAELEEVLNQALRINPKDADALLQRSAYYLLKERPTAAESDLNQVLQFRSDSAEAHYLLAKVHERRRRYESQKSELDKALELNPSLLGARVDLISVLLWSGSAATAMQAVEATPEAQRDTLEIRAGRNWTLLALGRQAEARKGIDEVLKSGKTPELLIQDAGLKLIEKRYPQAAEAAREALTMSPDDVRALNLMYQAYVVQNRTAEGIRLVRTHAASRPRSAAVQFVLGSILLAANDRIGARAAFSGAIQADPFFTLGHLSLVQMEVKEQSLPAARQRLEKLLTANSTDPVAWLWLGHLENMAGNWNAAIANYRKVLELEPSNPDALNNLGFLLAENVHRPDEALAYAQKAKEVSPASAAVDDTLGWVFYRKGLYSMAVKYLATGVKKESTPRRMCHLAMAYHRSGDSKRGREVFQAVLGAAPNLPEVAEARQVLSEPPQKSR